MEPKSEIIRILSVSANGVNPLPVRKKKVESAIVLKELEKPGGKLLKPLGTAGMPIPREPEGERLRVGAQGKAKFMSIADRAIMAKENAVVEERMSVKAALEFCVFRRGLSGVGQKRRGFAVHRTGDLRLGQGFRAESEKVPSPLGIAEGVAEAIAVGGVLSSKA